MISKFKASVEVFREAGDLDSLKDVLKYVELFYSNDYRFLTPIEVNGEIEDPENISPETVEMTRISDGTSAYLVAYTSAEELKKGPETAAYYISLAQLMDAAENTQKISGIVIDPWTSSFIFKNDLIDAVRKMAESKKVKASDVSDNFYVHALDPKPIDLIISIREKMPGLEAVKKVYLTGLNNDGVESYLLIVEFEGEEMGSLFTKMLEVLPPPMDGTRLDVTPYMQEIPTAELVYERI